jgi:hypothetical protein
MICAISAGMVLADPSISVAVWEFENSQQRRMRSSSGGAGGPRNEASAVSNNRRLAELLAGVFHAYEVKEPHVIARDCIIQDISVRWKELERWDTF